MPLPLTVCCFRKIQTGFTFSVPAHPCSPGQRALNGCCCCCMLVYLVASCSYYTDGLRADDVRTLMALSSPLDGRLRNTDGITRRDESSTFQSPLLSRQLHHLRPHCTQAHNYVQFWWKFALASRLYSEQSIALRQFTNMTHRYEYSHDIHCTVSPAIRHFWTSEQLRLTGKV